MVDDGDKRSRDAVTGRYDYGVDTDMSRMCICGHPLAVHVAGGWQCINGEACGPEATLEPCDCRKFRLSRRKAGRMRLSTGVASEG